MKKRSFNITQSFLIACLPSLFFITSIAHAGVDTSCEPNINMDATHFNNCSNLPILIPSNNSKTNMFLLLSDIGMINIKPLTQDKHLWTASYGIVPFESATLASAIENKVQNKDQNKYSNSAREFSLIYEERCVSLESGKNEFIDAVKNNKNIPNAEKQILIAERNKITECDHAQIPLIKVNPAWTTVTRQYASYLNGAISFYNTNYSTATKIYLALENVEDPWIKETSQYMLIRTYLNEAYATGIDSYNFMNFDSIEQSLVNKFHDQIHNYLKLYPNGRYTASARGLLRRAYWLTQQKEKIVDEFIWQMNHTSSPSFNLTMSLVPNEIDRIIFNSQNIDPKIFKEPFFLTVYDLMNLRASTSDDEQPISWNQLNTQKSAFKAQPELFQYLQAVHLVYVQNKPQEALKYLPKSTKNILNYLQLSQVFLKGKILEQINQNQAEQYWEEQLKQAKTSYQKGLFELTLAKNLNNKQEVNAFIGKKPVISQINLQQNFIQHHANEKSLEQIIQSSQSSEDQKQVALYTLLSKALMAQNFKLFNQYYANLPKNAAQYKSYASIESLEEKPPFSHFIWNGTQITAQLQCPDLSTLTKQLETTKHNQLLNVCLGEYIRSEHPAISPSWNSYEQRDSSKFIGTFFTRGDIYKNIIENEPKGDLHAYALYRAVMCYSPTGTNDCGDKDVDISVRKLWFNRLKSEYPNTTWAKSLKYYW
ncbi:hypothetical protein AOY20_13105 [Acinetobacter equi]|uniref:Outer membrane assembly lipoprotein YfiO n=2 Tax=Acinetobacter equi TaxID=1324350 RepID=A0A0N9WFZ4_9GAMM|nr:hypothetical protein AOY20_13105 [Acinetobacter equi]